MVAFERGRDVLLLLANEQDQALSLNEATTRIRIIDRLLIECLGWSHDAITTEPHQEGDYLDYVLGTPERRAVLEAKREGLHFELPAGADKARTARLSTIAQWSETNRAAVEQVLRYCQRAGIPVAVLCNGHQLVAFLGSRQDGIAPNEGKAILFHSLIDMHDNFPLLWDSLSPAGMRAGKLRRDLSRGGQSTPPPDRLSSRLLRYPGFRVRSELETDVRILADLFLQDLVQEDEVSDEFLRECYCTSGALSQYALVSKEILRSRYAAVTDVARVQTVKDRKGRSDQLGADILSAALTRRPLILLGDVGVGKTIFLKHFIRVEAADVLSDAAVFYVDFLKQSSLLEDVREFLVSSIEETLLDKYHIDIRERDFVRAVYNKEVNRFKKTLAGALEETEPVEFAHEERAMLQEHLAKTLEHIRRSLEHLRGTRTMNFVLVLDNLDHHESEFQERVFVVGQSLSETWPVAVFMSLRPDTFYASKKAGSLSAYQPRVFAVEPPRSDLVIVKRLEFAQRQLQKTGRLDSFPKGLTINSAHLQVYLDVLIEGFKNNDRLKELTDNLSSGNVRQALDFVSTFVGSGYVSTARILEVHRTGGLYILPIHEFMRAILYGEHQFYDPRRSAVANIFDITTNDGREHFALPILLAACQARGESQQDGYVSESSLYQHLQDLGFSIEQVEAQVDRGLTRKLLHAKDATSSTRSLRVTASGGYMHKRMITFFTYIDAILVDTPIVDPQIRRQLNDAGSIEERLERGELFRTYLNSQWTFEPEATTFDWPVTSATLRRDMDSAANRADIARQRAR